MKRAVCFLLLGVSLLAQSTASTRLNETLRAMARPGESSATLSAQLVDEMMAIAPSDRKPSRGALAGFANEFTSALIGKNLTEERVTMLQLCIVAVLGRSGTNSKPAKLLRDALTSVGVASSRIPGIITTFINVGEEVRGPDDTPVTPVRLK